MIIIYIIITIITRNNQLYIISATLMQVRIADTRSMYSPRENIFRTRASDFSRAECGERDAESEWKGLIRNCPHAARAHVAIEPRLSSPPK